MSFIIEENLDLEKEEQFNKYRKRFNRIGVYSEKYRDEIAEISDVIFDTFLSVLDLLPDSREFALGITKLQEAEQWFFEAIVANKINES